MPRERQKEQEDMRTGELLHAARERGLPANVGRLYHGIHLGRIPEAPKDDLGNRRFAREHLEAFVAYLENPPRPGRCRRQIGGGQ